VLVMAATGGASAQKYGGTIQGLLSGNPASLSIHDEAPTNGTVAMSPVYNNLVWYDPFKPVESLETIIPELAESYSWSPDAKEVTFKLHKDVKWHDGKAFTSRDVKSTFDIVRGASIQRMKLNPRKLWYANVTEIVAKGDYEVTFRLKRPQPSLLAMLAASVAPVMGAHVPPATWRTSATGTGPFMLKEYQRDRAVFLVRNPNYFVRGRPYLDGVQHNVIPARASGLAAYTAGQVHIATPSASTKPFADALKTSAKGLEYPEMPSTVVIFVLFNTRKAPFNDPKLRRAVSLALDRNAFNKAVLQGGALPGGAMLPPPAGAWGLSAEKLETLPGYGNDMAQSKEEAREIMRSLGYTAEKPLHTEILTSSIAFQTDLAGWSAAAMREVYIDAQVKVQDSGVYYGFISRRDFSIIAFTATSAADDPDVTFYEFYGCASIRNYSDYCNPQLEKLYDEQSQTFDRAKRLKLVQQIDETLVSDVARVLLGFRINYSARWSFVKNYPPHQAAYNYHRLQEVWLDK
jgi:peptide/nickel transport system substrate-binding protein